MAIPTPTIPSSINAVSAVSLNPTQNNKAFYLYSGLISVSNSESTIASINDIGPRDILIFVTPMLTDDSSDEMVLRIKVNGTLIFETLYAATKAIEAPLPITLIIPANTSLEVTFEGLQPSAHPVGISVYGYYLESL